MAAWPARLPINNNKPVNPDFNPERNMTPPINGRIASECDDLRKLERFVAGPVAGESAQAEHLDEPEVQVDDAQSADRAASVGVVPVLMPLRNQGGEVVALPKAGPRENQQEEAHPQTEHHKQACAEAVIPLVL